MPIVRPGASAEGPPGWAEAQVDHQGTMAAERIDEYHPQQPEADGDLRTSGEGPGSGNNFVLGSRKEAQHDVMSNNEHHARQTSASTYNTAQSFGSSTTETSGTSSEEAQLGEKMGLGAKIKDKIHLVGEKMALVPAKEGREGLDDVGRAARTQVSD